MSKTGLKQICRNEIGFQYIVVKGYKIPISLKIVSAAMPSSQLEVTLHLG